MTMRKRTPLHDIWHRRVEGQIRDAIKAHPEWFNFPASVHEKACINGLAKRIVGEIVAAVQRVTMPSGVAVFCSCAADADSVSNVAVRQRKDGRHCPSSESPTAAKG